MNCAVSVPGIEGSVSSGARSNRRQRRVYTVSLSEEFELPPGSARAEALMKRVGSAHKKERCVRFAVQTIDAKAATQSELGEATFDLGKALSTGRNYEGTLAVKDGTGKQVGELTCAVHALEALHALGGAYGGSVTGQASQMIEVSIGSVRILSAELRAKLTGVIL